MCYTCMYYFFISAIPVDCPRLPDGGREEEVGEGSDPTRNQCLGLHPWEAGGPHQHHPESGLLKGQVGRLG